MNFTVHTIHRKELILDPSDIHCKQSVSHPVRGWHISARTRNQSNATSTGRFIGPLSLTVTDLHPVKYLLSSNPRSEGGAFSNKTVRDSGVQPRLSTVIALRDTTAQLGVLQTELRAAWYPGRLPNYWRHATQWAPLL